jgi:hypothetical protein
MSDLVTLENKYNIHVDNALRHSKGLSAIPNALLAIAAALMFLAKSLEKTK